MATRTVYGLSLGARQRPTVRCGYLELLLGVSWYVICIDDILSFGVHIKIENHTKTDVLRRYLIEACLAQGVTTPLHDAHSTIH